MTTAVPDGNERTFNAGLLLAHGQYLRVLEPVVARLWRTRRYALVVVGAFLVALHRC